MEIKDIAALEAGEANPDYWLLCYAANAILELDEEEESGFYDKDDILTHLAGGKQNLKAIKAEIYDDDCYEF